MEKRARNWLQVHHGQVHRMRTAVEITVLVMYLLLFAATWLVLA